MGINDELRKECMSYVRNSDIPLIHKNIILSILQNDENLLLKDMGRVIEENCSLKNTINSIRKECADLYNELEHKEAV